MMVHFHLPSWVTTSVGLRVLQLLVIVQVAIIYSGVERYFFTVSRTLHFGFQVVLLASALAVIVGLGHFRQRFAAWPFAVWVVFYYAWGYLVSPHRSQVGPTITSAVLLNLLLVVAVVASLTDKHRLTSFVWAVQIVLLLNLAIQIAEIRAPRLIDYFALTLNPHTVAYTETRPAGLWAEPNEAAIAFLFGLVLTWWARGPSILIWIMRAAAVAGIFLTGSRSGLYPAVPLLLFFGVVELNRIRLGPLRLSVVVPAAFGIVVAAVWAGLPLIERMLVSWGVSASTVSRYLDFSQALQSSKDPSRTALASYWLSLALHGPIQGSGAFSFQGDGAGLQGAHNVFIMVFGEDGIVGLVLFLALWSAGLVAVLRMREVNRRDFIGLVILWAIWLTEGFGSHNQFTVVTQIISSILLFQLPAALSAETFRRDAILVSETSPQMGSPARLPA
jgi:hypothetical protein